MHLIVWFIIAIIVTEAITEIVTKSELFWPFRRMLFHLGQGNKFFKWLHNLFDCGYCFSVWVGALIAFLFLGKNNVELTFTTYLFTSLAIHRLSNGFHFMMDKLRGKDI